MVHQQVHVEVTDAGDLPNRPVGSTQVVARSRQKGAAFLVFDEVTAFAVCGEHPFAGLSRIEHPPGKSCSIKSMPPARSEPLQQNPSGGQRGPHQPGSRPIMNDTAKFGFPDAARSLGVSLRVLRHAVRTGKIPAPPHVTATASLSTEWLSRAQAAVEASPKALSRNSAQKIPAFARYKGTSAWHKYRNRVRAYANFRAAASQINPAVGTSVS